jgi:phosphoglucomutase
MSKSSHQRAQDWANNSAFDESSRKEVQELLDAGNEQEIQERFYKDLAFGTGGMRAILGQGTNRLNKYNIIKATHALSLAILKDSTDDNRVAISYDSRNYSLEFAKVAAETFAANGIKALIYKRLNPVALCSFAIRHHNCRAGVMVTASHNPPEYNGFKVFWADGAQVTPPNDGNVIEIFNSLNDYAALPRFDFDEGITKGLIEWLDEKTEDLYYENIRKECLRPELTQASGANLGIIYTALHGTGSYPCLKALRNIGLSNIISVPEQDKPDGSFPTVSSPNPENPEALAMAVELMKKQNADIVMGTDPDTDRVGVSLLHKGEVHYLNGNQIGLLMLNYILKTHKEKGTMPKNPYFVKTIVTTELQSTIAKSFGVSTENTLTGFKWICRRMAEIEKEDPSRSFVFATEESFGYLSHEYVRDKDGVSSIALMGEVALYYKERGMTLIDALDEIYEEHGFSQELLLSLNFYGVEGAEKIQRIMDNYRAYSDSNLSDEVITSLTDYQNLSIKNFKTGETSPLGFSFKSNVLGFDFESGNKLFLRPSGTEPKIKFYITVAQREGDLEDKKRVAMQKAEAMVNIIKQRVESI